jgi:hypothetical protein
VDIIVQIFDVWSVELTVAGVVLCDLESAWDGVFAGCYGGVLGDYGVWFAVMVVW